MQLGPTVSEILTAGSDLDRTAYADQPPITPPLPLTSDLTNPPQGMPWPYIIDGGTKFFNQAQPSSLREVAHHNTPGNYGMIASLTNFLFRGSWVQSDCGNLGVGLYPGTVPNANRPMWNNLIPIVWGLRVTDAKQQAQLADLTLYENIQVAPMEYTPPGSASLSPQLL
jgi:hypothetical protein